MYNFVVFCQVLNKSLRKNIAHIYEKLLLFKKNCLDVNHMFLVFLQCLHCKLYIPV